MDRFEPICPECGQEMISPENCPNCRTIRDYLQDIYQELVELVKQVTEKE